MTKSMMKPTVIGEYNWLIVWVVTSSKVSIYWNNIYLLLETSLIIYTY